MHEMNDQYHQEAYAAICNTGVLGLVSKLVHYSIDHFGYILRPSGLKTRRDLLSVLEVASGGGQHSEYIKHHFNSLLLTDIRPENIPDVFLDPRISKEKTKINAEELPYESDLFDRLIATCVLAHLGNPETALLEWKRVVREGGVISIYVPCEPGFLLRFLQSVVTRPKQKKLGFDAFLLHYREHRNHYPGMMTLVKHVFGEDVTTTNYPFPFLGWNFNIWTVVQIRSLSK
jgi:phosphatidylethanolamine/phosphatidyl-N-methylethanolamine N-methyltransferase